MSVARYIESLTLDDSRHIPNAYDPRRGLPKRSFRSIPAAPSAAPPMPQNLSAAVNVGSLLSFVASIDQDERDDVLYSVQLAQRGASGAYDRFTETESWYGKYVEILENLGWTGEQFAFASYDQDEGELRMDQAALAVITAIATQNQLAVLKQAISALKAAAEDDGTIRLFDFHTVTGDSGNFQLGAVQKADNEALSVALGAFYFRSTDARRRFLFFAWGEREVNFWTAAQKMTLNRAFYAQHRALVRQKLGASARDYIEGLTLG